MTDCVTKVELCVSCTDLLDKDVGSNQRLKLDYHFEKVQNLKLGVYDIDNSSSDLGDDDYLGGVELTLGQIVASKSLTRPLQLKKGKPAGKGSITITAEEIKDNRAIELEFEAKNLDKKVVKNNLSPSWKKFTVALQTFCGSDLERPLKVDCSDYDSDGTHDLIGSFTTKVSELMKAAGGSPMLTQYTFLDYVMGGCQINFTVC
ncbi:hypothetical protein F7725_017432 [Dissostichus mawsoni]|uniref:C2 domain-containing protein n=1 Tax=Dissostichus mawsoni TaxID=36200 RepID=A0A7J5Z6H3_DISMA|nr:hypothetical protein F7725_017432 [Dissostichus mawsoni]